MSPLLQLLQLLQLLRMTDTIKSWEKQSSTIDLVGEWIHLKRSGWREKKRKEERNQKRSRGVGGPGTARWVLVPPEQEKFRPLCQTGFVPASPHHTTPDWLTDWPFSLLFPIFSFFYLLFCKLEERNAPNVSLECRVWARRKAKDWRGRGG